MQKIGLTLLLLLSLDVCIWSQNNDSLWTQDQLSNATVLLYQQINDTTAKSGSGTLVYSENRFFLLTASHIAKELLNSAKILFRIQGDKPGVYALLDFSNNNSLNWHHHSTADMSMLELFPNKDSLKYLLREYSFPIKQINGSKTLPEREADLTFLGFPIIDLELDHFSPLTFTGYLSSGLITQLRYDTKTKCNFFYLNIPSIQGCSGSGVYYSVKKAMYYGGGVTLLIGIVHGTQGDNTGGKLAAITPSYYINDLLKEF